MKTAIFGIILITTLGACKKDYNCSCDYYAEGEYQMSDETKITATKFKAKKECKDLNSDVSLSFGGNMYHAERKCSLK
ncbi:hypothetical protein [Fluviicola sp.]|uniref:hypothetical protein n=1 Tax=Fluviicola sp. TaxID=1917219 RepID=UPI0031DABFDE